MTKYSKFAIKYKTRTSKFSAVSKEEEREGGSLTKDLWDHMNAISVNRLISSS